MTRPGGEKQDGDQMLAQHGTGLKCCSVGWEKKELSCRPTVTVMEVAKEVGLANVIATD